MSANTTNRDRPVWTLIIVLVFLGQTACGGSDSDGGSSGNDSGGNGDAGGTPTEFFIVSGNDQAGYAGSAIEELLILQVDDGDGNGLPGVDVDWRVSGGDGSLSQYHSTTDEHGRASTEWTLGPEEGEQQVTATVDSLGDIIFTATATLAPVSILVIGGDEQEATVGSFLPDHLGLRAMRGELHVANARFVFQTTNPHGGIYPSETLTDDWGYAGAGWQLGSVVGEQTVKVSMPDFDVDPIYMTATAHPGEPAEAHAMVPIWQWGTGNHEQPDSPSIRLTDSFGNPAAGYQIQFTALDSPSTGHTIEHTLVETDSDGIAAAGSWTIPDEPGAYVVRAEPANDESGNWDDVDVSMGIYNPAAFEKVWGATTGHATCALDASGIAYCWGSNNQPAVAAGGMAFTELALGSSTLYGLTADGDTYFVGNPTTSPPPSSATLVESAPKFEQIASGQSHRCGLTGDGTIYCWGNNSDGQSGAPSSTSSVTNPRAIDGDPPPFVHLDAGWRHTCALTDDGETYCWGRNGWGQIGDNSTEYRYEATAVVSDLRFDSLSLGNRYSCALAADGKIYCWGREFISEDPWVTPRLTPQQQATGHEFVEISAGGYHTCGRHADGSVVCWGLNEEGSWGDGSTEGIRETPGPVYGDHTFTRLASSWAHSCGITENGLLCWGQTDLMGFPWHDGDVFYPLFVSMPD